MEGKTLVTLQETMMMLRDPCSTEQVMLKGKEARLLQEYGNQGSTMIFSF